MAIPPLVVVQGQWINLYAATGITVGTQVIVQNFQSNALIAVSDTASAPTETDGRVAVYQGQFYQNDSGDLGLWAYCSGRGLISVQEV